MKAIVQTKYGSADDALELRDIDRPAPKDDEVLIRVRAASVNPLDWHYMRGQPYFMRAQSGLRAPKRTVLGNDVAGEVEAVGKEVTRLREGDEVIGEVNGSYAEYACASEGVLGLKPSNLTFEQAATIPVAGLTALQGLRDRGQTQSGQRVLIVGASGGVGTFAVQIAKWLGAEVTGVCSTRNLEMVSSIGADHTIDYTQEEFGQSEQRYDVIFQLGGMHSPAYCRRVLTPKGRLVLSSGDSDGRWIGPVDRMLKAMVLSPFVSQKLGSFLARTTPEDLQILKELIEEDKVKPVVGRTYSLREVPEAIRFVEEGHTRGKVVITVQGAAA